MSKDRKVNILEMLCRKNSQDLGIAWKCEDVERRLRQMMPKLWALVTGEDGGGICSD